MGIIHKCAGSATVMGKNRAASKPKHNQQILHNEYVVWLTSNSWPIETPFCRASSFVSAAQNCYKTFTWSVFHLSQYSEAQIGFMVWIRSWFVCMYTKKGSNVVVVMVKINQVWLLIWKREVKNSLSFPKLLPLKIYVTISAAAMLRLFRFRHKMTQLCLRYQHHG